MKKLLMIIAIFGLAGCTVGPSEKRYEAKLSSYVGMKQTELELVLGLPDDTIDIESGDTVYAYQQHIVFTVPEQTQVEWQKQFNSPYASYFALPTIKKETKISGQRITYHCTTYFKLDKETDKVTDVDFSGNSCLANKAS